MTALPITDHQHEFAVLTTMNLEMVQIALSGAYMSEDLVDRVEEFETRLAKTLGLSSSGTVHP